MGAWRGWIEKISPIQEVLPESSMRLPVLGNNNHMEPLDCHVEEPNDHIHSGAEIKSTERVSMEVPQVDISKCTPCG